MSPQHRKTCDTAVTGHGVASGPEFQNRTCTCDTSDCDTAVRPLPVSHPIHLSIVVHNAPQEGLLPFESFFLCHKRQKEGYFGLICGINLLVHLQV